MRAGDRKQGIYNWWPYYVSFIYLVTVIGLIGSGSLLFSNDLGRTKLINIIMTDNSAVTS